MDFSIVQGCMFRASSVARVSNVLLGSAPFRFLRTFFTRLTAAAVGVGLLSFSMHAGVTVPVGATPGTFAVSPVGAAAYSIPIRNTASLLIHACWPWDSQRHASRRG